MDDVVVPNKEQAQNQLSDREKWVEASVTKLQHIVETTESTDLCSHQNRGDIVRYLLRHDQQLLEQYLKQRNRIDQYFYDTNFSSYSLKAFEFLIN